MKRVLFILSSIIPAFVMAGQNRKTMKTTLFFLFTVVFSITSILGNSQDTIIQKTGAINLMLLSFGGRWMIKRTGLDFGLVFPNETNSDHLIAIPWLGLSIPFKN